MGPIDKAEKRGGKPSGGNGGQGESISKENGCFVVEKKPVIAGDSSALFRMGTE